MKRLLAITFCVCLSGYSLRAAEPTIVHGYGPTAWGQSMNEVAKLISLKEGAHPSGTTLVAAGHEPVSRVTYRFFEDHLCAVSVHVVFPEVIGQMAIKEEIERIIRKKYYQNETMASSLKEAGVSVHLKNGMGHLSTSVIAEVIYTNSKLRGELERQKAQRHEEEGRAALQRLGLEDLL